MKPDWDKSKKRFEAWWHGEIVDRVLIQAYAPKDSPGVEPLPTSLEAFPNWQMDADFRMDLFERQLALTHYAGDAFPYFDTHIGPGTMSLYLGTNPTFMPTTVWYDKCIDDITRAEVPPYDQNNIYWQFSQSFARAAVERFKGRALVSIPDLIEGLDTIASLVGTDELLFHLVDAPEHVHRFQKELVNVYFRYFDPLYEIVKDENGGNCFTVFDIYAPGRMTKVQCDFSAMISPKMFEEFVVPYLAEQCARLDYSVYHLDGFTCLQHLDLLLGIKELNAIQWTPGAGNLPPIHEAYIPLYKRILAGGKSAMIVGGEPEDARKLVEELGPEGLDISLRAASPEQADEIVKQSFSWKKSG